jgi:hypothetical protein
MEIQERLPQLAVAQFRNTELSSFPFLSLPAILTGQRKCKVMPLNVVLVLNTLFPKIYIIVLSHLALKYTPLLYLGNLQVLCR